ncbi:LamG-like jellyroll fold domain-containing protein [Prosthecobacter sp.]|uniref:LamG-like jellyroll fold domain-containing protein n=1 Tax=Prosthecobacter sp. TaxID=1965333 RepID=UPI003784AE53
MTRLALPLLALLLTTSLRAEFKAGAAVVDISPPKLPVLVNGGMLSRYVDKINTRVHARAIMATDGKTEVAIVVADSCMMSREVLDDAKKMAAAKTGIPADRMLISATHAHSTPASMGCLGTDPDPSYVPYLKEKLVEAIAAAKSSMVPARIGFAKADANQFTALRQWIRRPDRVVEDPFGNKSVRANMHAGRNWDDVTGESGPEDPDLSLISFQTKAGKPLAVLANFSMHYFGDKDISADYFGLFSDGLAQRIDPQGKMVGIMSHGCSGDIYRVDYTVPEKDRPKVTIEEYTNGLLDIAMKAYAGIKYNEPQNLAMTETRMTLKYRTPDKQRLEWAQRVMAEVGDRLAKTPTEVYAREQIILNERQQTEIVVQGLRIGDIGIATTPNETYAITGLKIKAASPLPHNMVIELANGGDGYIPPPEMHAWGGYNTWAARSAGLEVDAEPRITGAAIAALEKVSGEQRMPWKLPAGPAAKAVLDMKPAAYWRLNEFTGPVAEDETAHGHNGIYERDVAYYLEGPKSAAFCAEGSVNRAPHLVGARIRSRFAELGGQYSVSLWFWNGMPNEGRDVSGWLFSRGDDHGLSVSGDHLGIGGKSGNTGRLIFFTGTDDRGVVAGKMEIPRWQWQHLVLVRDGPKIRAYLNGALELETVTHLARMRPPYDCFFGGRSDGDSSWEGRLDEIAVFDRPLSAAEIAKLEVK